ncbi:MAG: dethiobiotin synthase [Planctomycetaceae bacterium]
MKRLLVTGTDTNVGKTWISCILLRQLRQQGLSAGAWKPVCSGSIPASDGSMIWDDVHQLANAIGWKQSIDIICPQRFHAPVAPETAAALEGRTIDRQLLISGINAWKDSADVVVIEGAGGLLCPVSAEWTIADLAQQWDCPLLIVAANRLGVINHTLLTAEVAAHRGLQVTGIVLNTSEPDATNTDRSRPTNQRHLQALLPNIPVFSCGYQSSHVEDSLCGQKFAAHDFFG